MRDPKIPNHPQSVKLFDPSPLSSARTCCSHRSSISLKIYSPLLMPSSSLVQNTGPEPFPRSICSTGSLPYLYPFPLSICFNKFDFHPAWVAFSHATGSQEKDRTEPTKKATKTHSRQSMHRTETITTSTHTPKKHTQNGVGAELTCS